MKPLMRSSIRTGLLAAAALQGAALALVAPEAHATWYCGIVDGPGNGNTSAGGTNAQVWATTAALPAASGAMPLFTGYNSNSTKIIMQTASASSWGGSQCAGNYDPYDYFFTIDSTTSVFDGPGVGLWGSEAALSYVDTSGSLYASISYPDVYDPPTMGTKIYSAPSNGSGPQATGTPRLAYLAPNGVTPTPYVFFTANFQPGANEYQAIYYKAFNKSTWTWSGGTPGTWLDGSSTENMRYPTAVSWNGQLWVFYWDESRGGLRAKYSTDGTTWTVTGVNSGFVDGFGPGSGTGNQTWDDVGAFPTALVDTSDNRLYVFYLDYSVNSLRFSYLDNGSSTWHSGVVQSGVNMDAPPAATVAGCTGCGGVQVWWVNTENNTLQGATRTGNTFGYQATVDGGSSNQCGSNGGTSHGIYGPIAGVFDSNVCRSGFGPGGSFGPHLYYQDLSTGALREAFWY